MVNNLNKQIKPAEINSGTEKMTKCLEQILFNLHKQLKPADINSGTEQMNKCLKQILSLDIKNYLLKNAPNLVLQSAMFIYSPCIECLFSSIGHCYTKVNVLTMTTNESGHAK